MHKIEAENFNPLNILNKTKVFGKNTEEFCLATASIMFKNPIVINNNYSQGLCGCCYAFSTAIITFSLQNDVNLRHKFFLNLYFRLRKIIFKNLETKG